MAIETTKPIENTVHEDQTYFYTSGRCNSGGIKQLWAPRVGAIYTDIKAPVAAGSGGGSRVGVATSMAWCYMPRIGRSCLRTQHGLCWLCSVQSSLLP